MHNNNNLMNRKKNYPEATDLDNTLTNNRDMF